MLQQSYLVDYYRALAGVAGSEKIDGHIKATAEMLMKECMDVMQTYIEIEKKQIKKFSAELNGIIT